MLQQGVAAANLRGRTSEEEDMRNRFTGLWALGPAAALLASCAAPYTPTTREDAAKLRIRLGSGYIFSTVAGHLRPMLEQGRCGEVMRFPQMFPYAERPAEARGPQATDAPPRYPRAGMVGSPDPLRSDVVELAVAPGRHAMMLIGTLGTSQCFISVELALAPNGQHELEFRFDGAQRRCWVTGTRLDPAGAWRPLAVRPSDGLCKG
jgi:hypothetical protein